MYIAFIHVGCRLSENVLPGNITAIRSRSNMKITHTNHNTEIDQFIRILLLTKYHVTCVFDKVRRL